MKNYIFSFLLSLFCLQSIGQVPGCEVNGSPDLTYFDVSTAGSHPNFTIKVYFNIVRDFNGDGGYDPARIPNVISQIDGAFNQHGITFEYVCDDIFIDNTDLATFGVQDNFWCDWFDPSVPRHSDGIDIFIVTGFHAGTFAGRVSTVPGKFMVLNGGTGDEANQNARIESTTIVHELGHLFGLLHMWHGATQNLAIWPDLAGTSCSDLFGLTDCGRQFTCPYSATFSNCVTGLSQNDENECAEGNNNGAVAGDYIPDTPPSHRFVEQRAALPSCAIDLTYTVTNDGANKPSAPEILTPDDIKYNPDITNFMSTSKWKSCRDNFSPNQVTVMKNHIQSHPILSGVHSTKGALVCDCDFENIIYLRDTKNWSTVIAEQGISLTQLIDFEIVVEQDLIIDQDYTFENVKFTFNTNSELQISNSAIEFTSNSNSRTLLNSCSGRWNGIVINGNSDVDFTSSDIENTKNAIIAESGTSMNVHDLTITNTSSSGIQVKAGASLSLDQATIQGLSSQTSSYGIRVFKGANNPSLFNFTISDFQFGVYSSGAENVTFVDQGNISNVQMGVYFESGTPVIDFLTTSNSLIGIYAGSCPGTVLTNSTLGCTAVGAVINHSPASFVAFNTIGTVSEHGDQGLIMSSSGGSFIGDNPHIQANEYGVYVHDGTVTMERCTVHVESSPGIASAGVQLVGSVGSHLVDNVINGRETSSGIETIMCTGDDLRSISNNDIFHFSSSADRTAAIRSMGSIDETIARNDIDGFFLVSQNSISQASGLMAQNTTINTYDCNFIDETTEGLGVYFNADFHTLKGNHFLNSLIDLEIRSVIGRQEHHGNVFVNGSARATELSSFDVIQSRFIANCAHPSTSDLCPSDPVPVSGWIIPDPSTVAVYTCTGNIGPGAAPADTSLCTYFAHLKTTKDSLPEQFFVKLYHLLRLEKVKDNYILPDCIKQDSTLQALCGLLELVDVKTSLDRISETETSTSSLSLAQESFGQANNSGKESARGNLEQELMSVKQDLLDELVRDSLSLDSLRSEIDLIQCTDSLLVKWKDILKAYIIYIQEEEVAQGDRTMLMTESQSCSDRYGDAIHLARALANTFTTTHYDIFDDCISKGPAPRSAGKSVPTDITVYPNPSTGLFNIDFGSSFSGSMTVVDLTGKVLLTKTLKDLQQTILQIQGEAGVYYLQCESDDGIERIQKILLID